MKKKNKLVLDRETVAVLQSDALDGVNGGQAIGTIGTIATRYPGCGGGSGVTSQLISCNSRISQVSEQISRQISRGFSLDGQK